MSNPLFNLLGGNAPTGNMMQMVQQFQQFRNNFKGDPKAEVQRLLQSGRISQADLNRIQAMAAEFQKIIK